MLASNIEKKMTEENGESSTSREEQEEALVALIEHRTREVQHLQNRISYYQSQVWNLFFFIYSLTENPEMTNHINH